MFCCWFSLFDDSFLLFTCMQVCIKMDNFLWHLYVPIFRTQGTYKDKPGQVEEPAATSDKRTDYFLACAIHRFESQNHALRINCLSCIRDKN